MAALIVIVVLAFPIVGAAIGSAKGHTVGGFFLGLFFGPLGWLIALIMGPSRKIREEEYAAWHQAQQQAPPEPNVPAVPPTPAERPPDPPGWT
jgi:hypothetical protein